MASGDDILSAVTFKQHNLNIFLWLNSGHSDISICAPAHFSLLESSKSCNLHADPFWQSLSSHTVGAQNTVSCFALFLALRKTLLNFQLKDHL